MEFVVLVALWQAVRYGRHSDLGRAGFVLDRMSRGICPWGLGMVAVFLRLRFQLSFCRSLRVYINREHPLTKRLRRSRSDQLHRKLYVYVFLHEGAGQTNGSANVESAVDSLPHKWRIC